MASRFLRHGVLAGVLLGGAASGSASAAPIIEVAGSTAGCWGTTASCVSYLSSMTEDGVTFTQGVFSQLIDFGGASPWPSFVIGSFSRGAGSVGFNGDHSFVLEVTFTDPSEIIPGLFTATISGNATGSGGPTQFDFDNSPRLYSFSNGDGSGSFEFVVLSPSQLTPNGTVSLYGQIQDMRFIVDEQPVHAPEPASLVLLGTGLATAAVVRRRRARRRT